jgi:hypothetical protein
MLRRFHQVRQEMSAAARYSTEQTLHPGHATRRAQLPSVVHSSVQLPYSCRSVRHSYRTAAELVRPSYRTVVLSFVLPKIQRARRTRSTGCASSSRAQHIKNDPAAIGRGRGYVLFVAGSQQHIKIYKTGTPRKKGRLTSCVGVKGLRRLRAEGMRRLRACDKLKDLDLRWRG